MTVFPSRGAMNAPRDHEDEMLDMNAQTLQPILSRLRNEHGAVLIQVAIACIVLIAFTMFVVDQGIMFVSRRQAQNSADAGALAGAIALSFDDYADRSDGGPAKRSARTLAVSNSVWAQAPDVNITTDVTFPACPDDGSDGCVRVDVYRNQARSNPLPSWFGGLVGVSEQGVRATATAQATTGNATDCLKPWAVIDKWAEKYPTPKSWDLDDSFDKYKKQGNSTTLDPSIDPPDEYIAPDSESPGTGFRPHNADGSYSDDWGRRMWLKEGSNNDVAFGSGWFMALALGGTGGSVYGNNIKGCIGITYAIGDELALDNEPGNKVGPTRSAVGGPSVSNQDADSLYNQDPTAYWDPGMNDGRGGIAGSAFAVSPRIVAVPVINPDLIAEAQNGGRTTVPISNIIGFFVEGYEDKGVTGRIVTMPGMNASGGSTLNQQSSFIKVIQLVR